jgi:hypothetical protein
MFGIIGALILGATGWICGIVALYNDSENRYYIEKVEKENMMHRESLYANLGKRMSENRKYTEETSEKLLRYIDDKPNKVYHRIIEQTQAQQGAVYKQTLNNMQKQLASSEKQIRSQGDQIGAKMKKQKEKFIGYLNANSEQQKEEFIGYLNANSEVVQMLLNQHRRVIEQLIQAGMESERAIEREIGQCKSAIEAIMGWIYRYNQQKEAKRLKKLDEAAARMGVTI